MGTDVEHLEEEQAGLGAGPASLGRSLRRVAPGGETVVALGVFDGVHLGHCHLLRQLIRLAGPERVPLVVAFSNHPSTVLDPGVSMAYLTSLEARVELLKAQGVETVVSLEFTRELARGGARRFLSLLSACLGMRGLVVGPEAAIGWNGEGGLGLLERRGEGLGFWVESAEPFLLDGTRVGSGAIRRLLERGEVEGAAAMLGRGYSLTGEVVGGTRRGREMGFPTANLGLEDGSLMPGDGIYATWATVDGVRYPAATSVGTRPTFDLEERLTEVHILDFERDIYGSELSVEFARKLRDQEKFSGLEELVSRIHQDVAETRRVLACDGDGAAPHRPIG